MDRSERAKQFAPFDALRGLREALERKEREHERQEKRMRTEEETEALERVLPLLSRGKKVEALFYEGGFYLQARGVVEDVDLIRSATARFPLKTCITSSFSARTAKPARRSKYRKRTTPCYKARFGSASVCRSENADRICCCDRWKKLTDRVRSGIIKKDRVGVLRKQSRPKICMRCCGYETCI